MFLLLLGFTFVIAENGEDEYDATIKLSEGWNLITSYAIKDALGFEDRNGVYSIEDSDYSRRQVEEQNIKAVFLYDSAYGEYVQAYPTKETDKLFRFTEDLIADEKRGNGRGDSYYRLTASSRWVYSNVEQTTEVHAFDGPGKINKLILLKGWNFMAISPDWEGKKFADIKGDCQIEEVYFWDAVNKEWDEISVVPYGRLGYGFIIKSVNDCSLSEGDDEIPQLP